MRRLVYIVVALLVGCALTATGRAGKGARVNTAVVDTALYNYFYMEGVQQKLLGNNNSALSLFNEASRIDTSSTLSQYEAAKLYWELNQYDTALSLMRKVVYKETTRNEYNLTYSIMAYNFEEYDESEKALLRILRSNPTNDTAAIYLSNLYINANKYDKALACLEGIKSSDDAQIEIQRITIYAMQHDTARVVENLEKLIERYKHAEWNLLYLGQLYKGYGLDSLYHVTLNKALLANPDNADTYIELGNYYLQHRDSLSYCATFDKLINTNNSELMAKDIAIEHYIALSQHYLSDSIRLDLCRQWCERFPNQETPRSHYIRQLKSMGMQEEVFEQFTILAQNNDKNGNLWELLMIEYLTNGLNTEAIIAGETAIEAGNEGYNVYFVLANSYLAIDAKRAYQYAQEAVERCTEDVFLSDEYTAQECHIIYNSVRSDLLGFMGDAANAMHDTELCYQHYDSALVCYPNNINVLNNYAYTLACNGGDLDKAERMSLTTIQSKDASATYLDTYAWILFKKEQYTLARIYIERAIYMVIEQQETGLDTLYHHYGDILALSGDMEKAIAAWQKAYDMGCNDNILKQKLEHKKYIEE